MSFNLPTHPRTTWSGRPKHLLRLGFDSSGDGGGGDGGQDKPEDKPKADSLQDRDPKEGDRTARSEADKTDWVTEAKKWEKLAKDHQEQLKKLAPLEKLAAALAGDDKAGDAKNNVDALTERLTKHEEDLQTERTARWRAEVAHEKGLTPAQAARLSGDTREALAADAAELLKLFPAPEPGVKPLYVPQSGSGDKATPKGSVAAGRDLFKASRPATATSN